MEKREFVRRRKRLMDMIDAGGIAIQPTAPERVRNRDVYFPHRPDSDFFLPHGFSGAGGDRGHGAGSPAG